LHTLISKVAVKLKKISEECQFGGQITAGIMSLTGNAPKNFKAFAPSSIVSSAIEFVEMKHSRDRIEGNKPEVVITNHVPPNLPLIFGSDAQVRDCLFNVIDNAYDAAYEKDRKIKDKAHGLVWPQDEVYHPQIELNASTQDDHLIITITDNGIGVKDEDKPRLFAGYFTTKATSVKGYGKGGHGIGLFTVKKLILAHKGKLYFASEYGKGTTFTIELPLAKKEDKESNA
jgi:signal transduction histidine kinase